MATKNTKKKSQSKREYWIPEVKSEYTLNGVRAKAYSMIVPYLHHPKEVENYTYCNIYDGKGDLVGKVKRFSKSQKFIVWENFKTGLISPITKKGTIKKRFNRK